MASATASRVIEEIVSGAGIGPATAAKLVPALHKNEGETLSAKTIIRYMRVGVRAPDGTMVKLEAACIGNRWITSRPALGRFIAALTPVVADGTRPESVSPAGIDLKRARAASERIRAGST